MFKILIALTLFLLFFGCTSPDTFIIQNAKISKVIDVNDLNGSVGQVPFLNEDGNLLSLQSGFDFNSDTNSLNIKNVESESINVNMSTATGQDAVVISKFSDNGKSALIVEHLTEVASRKIADFLNNAGYVLRILGNGQVKIKDKLNIGLDDDRPARLFIQQVDSGTSDLVMSPSLTLNSRSVGMILESSQTKSGSNAARPGIFMFASRNDGFGIAFPLFRIYTAYGDEYTNNNKMSWSAYAASGNNLQFMYFGMNDKDSFNNNIVKLGYNGMNINVPGFEAPDRAFDVRGDSHFSGNVGIGTLTPTVKLDVVGSIKSTGNITTDGNVYAKDFITTSKVANSKDGTKALDNISNIDEWLKNGKIQYDKHYAMVDFEKKVLKETIITYENVENCFDYDPSIEGKEGKVEKVCKTESVRIETPVYETQIVKGLSMETRVAEMEKMIWELNERIKVLEGNK